MRLIFVLALCLSACASAPATSRPSQPESAWTELGAGGTTIVRAVTNGACPILDADGRAVPLHPRQNTSEDFPLLVCEVEAPAGARALHVGGMAVPSGSPEARRILFLGDTGCRIKKGKNGKVFFQKCNDPSEWPFARLAAAAAAWKPDLVIHVGDYHYREADCPAGEPACAGSETGDRWASWRQDFFSPAAPLLAAAPWIFVRGNHENCDRAGRGWFRLLDAGPAREKCTDSVAPFEVPVPGHRLYVLDSGEEKNIAPSFAAVSPSSDQRFTWLLLHRPILTTGADDFARMQARFPPRLAVPGAISAVFSGHRHILSLSQFTDSRPPEIITGNGGDSLDVLDAKKGEKPANFNFHDFGFLTFERDVNGGPWLVEEHDRAGAVIGTCSLTEIKGQQTELRCAK